jgi:hypothetical protein
LSGLEKANRRILDGNIEVKKFFFNEASCIICVFNFYGSAVLRFDILWFASPAMLDT